MPSTELAVVGPSSPSRAKHLTVQSTLNMYASINNDAGERGLFSVYGKKRFSTGTTDANRGILSRPWNGNVYLIHGQNFYRCNSAGVQTSIGAVSGTGRCILEATPNYVYAATGDGRVWRTDGATVEEVTDSDLESPDSLAYINSQLLYDGTGPRFTISDAGQGGTINPLNYASAEAYPDNIVRVYAFDQVIRLFCDDSVEHWFNPGTGTPPVQRINEAIINVGIAGPYAVTNTVKNVYFLGNDNNVYRIEGYTEVQETTTAMANEFERYSTTSDCFAYAYRSQGLSFVVFSFPTANKTWQFCEEFRTWTQLSSGTSGNRDIANGYCYAFGKHLVTDYRNGNILQLDINTFDDDGGTLLRERVTPTYDSKNFGASDRPVFWNSIKLVVNPGYGLATGQGSDPMIMMEYSNDSHTWISAGMHSLGVMGNYGYELYWYGLGKSDNGRTYRFRVSDPIDFNIFELHADVEIGI